MKKALLILAIFAGALRASAQDVDYVELKNDVFKIGKKISGLGGYNDGTTLMYHHDHIELYSDGNSKEYVLKILVETAIGAPHIFSNETRLFINIGRGKVLELHPIVHSETPYGEGLDWKTQGAYQTCKSEAFFPLTEEQLMSICKAGNTKAILPLLTVSNEGSPTVFEWKITIKGKDIKKFVKKTTKDLDNYLSQAIVK